MEWIPGQGKKYCTKKKCGLPLILEPRYGTLYYVCLACKCKTDVDDG